MKPVKQIEVEKGMKVVELVEEMKEASFGARKIAEASEIFEEMVKDKLKGNCKIFFGLAGAMVPGGMKNIIVDMLRKDYIDVFVATGANLTHDLIEALGEKHYQCTENIEKIDDAELNKKGLDRIYDVFMKNSVYEKLEDFFEKNWQEISKAKNIKEFLWQIGECLEKNNEESNERNENSVLRVCYEKKIPIFCPAIADSAIGLMVWGRIAQGKKINIDAFDDMKEIIDITWTAKKRGVVYVGGGVPKNFIQQSMQFTKGADYAIQITTDRPETGGSSGAPLKEGISWGKLKKEAKYVNVFCDATIALPLIYAAVKDKLEK